MLLSQAVVRDRPYVDFDTVVTELAQHGTWQPEAAGKFVFQPKGLPPSWAPFREGQWVYTDYGWTWMGRDRGAWATGHYGHWKLEAPGKWVWVPGKDWLAAGVEWFRSGKYVGWRPAHLDRFNNPLGESTPASSNPEEWSFVLLEKLRGPLKPEDFADRETTAGLLAAAVPADHIFVAHWDIPRPGPSPEVLKDAGGKQPPVWTVRDRPAMEPDAIGTDGYLAYRPRFHQDGDGIFRRVELFLNPRKENPGFESVKDTLAPDRKPDAKEQKLIDQQKERERQYKKHQEDLYR